MSIIHLVIFVLQFFLVIPALLWLFQRAKKDGRKRSKLLAVVIAVICYASLNSYFHRYLILSDAYYVFGDWKKSKDMLKKDLNSLKTSRKFMMSFMAGIVCIGK